MYIDATEEFIFNYEYFPEELNGWRYYRLEYGGSNEDCKFEGRVLLPPNFDIEHLLEFLNKEINENQSSR
jgi:hypothetical protein